MVATGATCCTNKRLHRPQRHKRDVEKQGLNVVMAVRLPFIQHKVITLPKRPVAKNNHYHRLYVATLIPLRYVVLVGAARF